MSNKTYDVVLVGSGHNGMTAAAYMAKAGMSVLVLEKNDWYGGGTVTQEVFPGFRTDLHSAVHVTIQANPLILKDELKLQEKYGLEYKFPEALFSTIFEDGTSIVTYRDIEKTCESIAKISPKDADAYRRFAKKAMEIVPIVTQGLFSPPPQQGTFYALLDQSLEGQDILRALMMNKIDICREWFEDDKVIIHLTRLAMETLTSPDVMGTGFILYTLPGMMHSYPMGVPVGGSGSLANALIACLKDHGAEFRKECAVEKVLVTNGRATGVRLADGEVIHARKGVIGMIHPWLIGDMVEGVDAGVVERAKRVQTGDFSVMVSHMALTESPQFKADDKAAGDAILISYAPPTMERFLKIFDGYKYGDIKPDDSDDAIWICLNHGRFDETRCPPGQAAISVYGYAPYNLRGGAQNWKVREDEISDWLLARFRETAPNVTDDKIIGRRFDTPLELESHSSMFPEGDVSGCGEYLHQIGGHRPNAELSKLKVPGVDGLYLSGTAIHVSSVSGAGRATAIKMCQDLNIDFDKMVE